jgi:hypothetical protein
LLASALTPGITTAHSSLNAPTDIRIEQPTRPKAHDLRSSKGKVWKDQDEEVVQGQQKDEEEEKKDEDQLSASFFVHVTFWSFK